MYDLATRSAYIYRQIENGRNIYLQDSNVKLQFVEFNKRWSTGRVSTSQSRFEQTAFCHQNDESILENKRFSYPGTIASASCFVLHFHQHTLRTGLKIT